MIEHSQEGWKEEEEKCVLNIMNAGRSTTGFFLKIYFIFKIVCMYSG